MLLYPTNRRVNKQNSRQRKKHHLGEFRKTTIFFKVKFKNDLSDESLEKISDAYINFIENLDLASSGFDAYGNDADGFHENTLSKVCYRKDGSAYSTACTQDEIQKVMDWLRTQKEFTAVSDPWIDDAHYCYLAWPDDDREWFTDSDFTNSRGKAAIEWHQAWLNKVNKANQQHTHE